MKTPALKLLHLTCVCTLTVILTVALSGIALCQEDATEQASGGPQSGDEFTVGAEGGAELPEMVVEAENKVRQDIHKGTFEFPLDAATVDSFFTAMDEEALSVSPVSGLKPHLNNLETLASDQVPHYWIREMASTPVATFFPADPEGHKMKSWDLAITDFRGSPFKLFTGGGKPPSEVDWDGLSDRGEMLQVGYPYSYVFSITDKGTNTYNYAGVSFRIPALDYKQDGDRLLELAGGELFTRHEHELTEFGKEWLVRSCDEIRHHPYSPIRVTVVAEELTLAERRADIVASFLAESMIIPREQVETEVEQRPDLRAEMDGSVLIAIEHAD